MPRGLFAAALVAVVLAGCAHVHPTGPGTSPVDLERVNSELAGRTVLLRLSDGSEFMAQDVRVDADSVRLRRRTVPLPSSTSWARAVAALPIERVQEIEVVRRGRGALEGGLIGLGVGALVGIPIGGSWHREGVPPDLAGSRVIGSVLFGTLGGVTGAVAGAAIGTRDIYDLTGASPPD